MIRPIKPETNHCRPKASKMAFPTWRVSISTYSLFCMVTRRLSLGFLTSRCLQHSAAARPSRCHDEHPDGESAEVGPEAHSSTPADEGVPDIHEDEADDESEQPGSEGAHDRQDAADGPRSAHHGLESRRVDLDVEEPSEGAGGQVEGKESEVSHGGLDDGAG